MKKSCSSNKTHSKNIRLHYESLFTWKEKRLWQDLEFIPPSIATVISGLFSKWTWGVSLPAQHWLMSHPPGENRRQAETRKEGDVLGIQFCITGGAGWLWDPAFQMRLVVQSTASAAFSTCGGFFNTSKLNRLVCGCFGV